MSPGWKLDWQLPEQLLPRPLTLPPAPHQVWLQPLPAPLKTSFIQGHLKVKSKLEIATYRHSSNSHESWGKLEEVTYEQTSERFVPDFCPTGHLHPAHKASLATHDT